MPAGLYTPSSELEPIVGIQFGIFSPEEIERRSVVEITSHTTYDGNEPKIGGLFDPRMGVLDNGKQCRSCGQTNHHCPGHFGHYRLARPVYYIQFFPWVLNVLRCVCVRCSKLLIDKDLYKRVAKRKGEGRWREVLNACNNITRCGQQIEDGCGARQPDRYVKEGIARIIAEWDDAEGAAARPSDVEPQKVRQPLEVEYVLRIFRQILDEDVDFMGLSRHWCRPDWMICSTLSVPPPQMRPSVVQDNNQRSEDDLTHKLVDIIKTNKTLQQKIDANASKGIVDEWTNVLQYHVATLINNQIPGVAPSAQRSGRAVKSIQQRLGSKEGRIRYNIQGKRVEFSARSVITPDPNLSIGELGVPMKIAMNLTFPEKVTQFNRDKLYRFVQNGADVYPGAKTIVRADGRMISLKHVNTKELVLYSGDTVNRHIMDGDIILFNRQPTLHRMSMMGHKARVLPYNTFRLNVSAVSPYNADFDGDEMNAHIPQSYEASMELEEIAAVRHQIIGPREGKPSIGIVQDTLVGSYRLTKNDNHFTRREYMNLMMYNKNFEGLPKPAASAAATPGGERYTGHQVVSSLLPPINMDMGNKSFDDDPSARNKVKIVEGQIVNGIIDKDIYSKAGKGIVHVSYNDYGSVQTVEMIDSLQTTIESFLVLDGFSVGISDMIADEKTRQQMEEVIQARKKEVNELNLQVHLDLFDNNTGKSNQDEFETRVFASLNKATKESGEFGQLALADENRLVAMVKAGSKGGPINIAQMIACVGQQNIEGRRIPYGFSDRTLPHYKKYDDGPEARGFIESSFIGGLTPQEFFFHAMSGREGLIDTAVKSVSGDTEIVVIEDGVAKKVEIGPWIDAQLATASNIEKYDATHANLELLNITHEVTIPTVDEDGNTSWGKITAITRHDPGDKIYAIKTQGGRNVIVSAGKSLLIWDNITCKFGEKPTPEVKIGDYVPVTVKLPTPPITTGIDILHFISNLNSVENANFQPHNDVVLDIITEINEMSPDNYPKLYDLTVPSTLNFGLANGLQVRDTADTGYIQRQLVKAMEDLTVHYDGTVRDTNMNIVQFHYGEDGLNATKIEGTSLSYVKLSEADIRREFGLAKVDFATILGDGLLTEDFADTAEVKTYVEQVLADRKMVVEGIFGSGRQGGVFAPLNLERLIMNLRVRFGLKPDAKTDLTPTYVLQGIDKLIQRTQPYHKLWCALLRFYFAPHKLIVKERFSKASFDTLCELCVVKDWKARSLPGELVGIIAAQSIGEPSTQMSSVYSTRIAVRNVKTQEHFVGPIGKLIDTILENDKSNVIQIGENSVVLDLDMENGYEIIGVSNDEKTSWKKISQVSRHPANGGLVEITTKSGRKTTATLTHSFLTRGPKGVIPILGSELKVGTRVPIARQIPEVASPLYSLTFELTKEFGWLCGIYLADGSLNGNTVCICKIHPIVEEKIRAIADVYKWDISVRNYDGAYGPSKNIIIHCKDLKQFLCKHFSSGSYEKNIAAPVFQSNLAFIQGIISGYFDGDGNVNVERQQIRVGSRSKTLIHDIAALLSYCGIFGSFGEETSIRIPGKILYTYQILKKYAAQFRNTVGLHLNEKSAALDAIVEYMERDGKHDTKEIYDKIPELGEIIAETGRLLTMPGQSRNFGRWSKKESIGRLTLQGYIEDFEEVLSTRMLDAETDITIRENITLLRSAAYSDIVWDEIVELQILEDPKEFVYDFTVPGNDSFMVDDNILVHNTLNTFHLAGVAAKSNVTRGVPRLKELLKVTDNPKAISLSVYLKPEFRQNKDKAREVAQDLELTLLRDITVKTGIYYDPSDEKTIVGEDAELIEFYKLFEGRQKEEAGEGEEEEDVGKWSKWLLRLELDRERMFNKNISMDDISYILNYNFGQNVSLIYSDFNAKKLVMRIRLSIEDKSHGFGDDIAGLKKFQNKMLNGIVIRGVPGIRAVTFRKHADLLEHVKGEYKPIEQYVLDTDGSNFIEVMNHPAVDGSRIYSTHVHDIYCTLGVEATRAILLSELTGLFEEAGVNYRHLGILCDTMTRNGRLMSIDRYGINKSDNGPLAKASFEETEKILLKAALFGEIDPITGVSANIMTGQPIRAGTAFASILLDESALERMLQGLPPTEEGDDVEEDGAELTQEMIDAEIFEDTNDACATTQLRMNINLPTGDSMLDEPDGELTII